jgi:HCOMODA/2-hydroxy-3-carboxy-muconic semialdehyde decarboxylase
MVDELVLGNHILANEGACDGLGHISVRHNERRDRFLLSRGMAPAVVTAADVMEYDLEGKPVDQQGRSMYGERFIHAAIFKARPDVNSVAHCHTPSVLPFANSDVPMRPMYQMSAFLIKGAPVFEIRKVPGSKGMLVNNMTTGDALAKVLGASSVVLMRGHGLVVVGMSIPEAVSNAIHIDVNAQMQTQAAALGGKVTYLADDEASGNPYERFWDHWKVRLRGR